jgi:hypothetical protein
VTYLPVGRPKINFGGAGEPKAAGKPTNTQQENQQAQPQTKNSKLNIATTPFGADTTNHPKQTKSRRVSNPITGAAYDGEKPDMTKPRAAPAPAPVENAAGLPKGGANLHTSAIRRSIDQALVNAEQE